MNKHAMILSVIFSCAVAANAQTGAERQARNPKDNEFPAAQAAKASPLANGAANEAAGSSDKKDEDCGCEITAPDTLAIVNGVKITRQEIDERIKDELMAIKGGIVEARWRELDLQINSKLLKAEARRRGVSPVNLLEQEVVAKIKEPAEAEARAFYDQYKNQATPEFAAVKSDVVAHLRYLREQEGARAFADRLRAAAQIRLSPADQTQLAGDADRARVVAVVGDENVTLGEIEDAIRPLNFKASERIFGLRKKWLDVKINDILLEQEAKRRAMTVATLLESEVNSKMKEVTEDRLRAFYELNKTNLNGDYNQLKEPLSEYLKSRDKNMAAEAFAAELRGRAVIRVFLAEPEPFVYAIAIDDQPVKGNPSAPVTIVEFSDFQCPTCAGMQPITERLLKEFDGKVKLVMRDFPLRQHAYAVKAAEAAEAAREQGKYWEYAALLYSNRTALSIEDLKKYASQLGLDQQRFDQALASGKFADQVRRDVEDGLKAGVNSTPAFFVNGRQVPAPTYETLKQALESALKEEIKLKASSNR